MSTPVSEEGGVGAHTAWNPETHPYRVSLFYPRRGGDLLGQYGWRTAATYATVEEALGHLRRPFGAGITKGRIARAEGKWPRHGKWRPVADRKRQLPAVATRTASTQERAAIAEAPHPLNEVNRVFHEACGPMPVPAKAHGDPS